MSEMTFSPEMTQTMALLEAAAKEAAANPSDVVLTPAEQLAAGRARGEQLASFFPAPADVKVERIDIGGVPSDILTTPGVREDSTILYLHGGGYVAFSAFTHRDLAARIGRTAGFRVVLPEYRLAPEDPYPAAIEDAVAVYRALAEQGPVVVAGDSAGGGLTLALWQRLRDLGDAVTMPPALALISPWTDLARAEREGSGDDVDAEGIRHLSMATNYAGDAPLDNPEISPLLADLTGLPPTHLEVSGGEYLEPDCLKLRDRIVESGGVATLHMMPGMIHVYAFLANTPEGRDCADRVANYLAKALESVSV